MKEKPILFNSEMVKAVLEGRKTMTRRVVKPQPPAWEWTSVPEYAEARGLTTKLSNGKYVKCPYGAVGDQLWVRESFHYTYGYPANHDPSIWYSADGEPECGDWSKGKPSIHMPRWASRIQLEVTGVRVERVQDISVEDCLAEGIPPHVSGMNIVYDFRDLWDSINGKPRKDGTDISWKANPWVWVVEFKVK